MGTAMRILFVVLLPWLTASGANAEIVKVPVDPSVAAAPGVPGYDPTVFRSVSSEPGLYVQPTSGTSPPSSGGTVSAQGTVGIAATSVGQLLRWPALPKYSYFKPMTGSQAYYRDAFTAIRYTAYATHDGEQWVVKALVSPSSGRSKSVTWPTLTWYEQVAGYSWCYYMPGWLYYICGSRSIEITAYVNSQCKVEGGWSDGQWTMQVFDDGELMGEQSFTMLPQVPEEDGDLVHMNQLSAHSYDTLCYKVVSGKEKKAPCSEIGAIQYQLKQKGCSTTASAMLLRYHGGGFTPESLDEALVAMGNAGYSQGDLDWRALPTVSGRLVDYEGRTDVQADEALKEKICKYGPQVMHIPNHFVTVYGRNIQNTTWLAYDPGSTLVPKKEYSSYKGFRAYFGREVTYYDPLNAAVFRLRSPAELLVTAPDGKQTGFDPIRAVSYSEIPKASYGDDAIDNDETGEPDNDPTKVLEVPSATTGEYIVRVTGTGGGTYDLSVTRYDPFGNYQDTMQLVGVPVQTGEIHQYSILYSTDAAARPSFRGGYDGGGQKPGDVNRFLRYANPGAARTTMPAGSTNFRLVITYDESVNPASFLAVLNGTNVSSLFAPAMGKTETVQIPLASGSSTLVLSIDGTTASGRTAIDTDRLVFIVP